MSKTLYFGYLFNENHVSTCERFLDNSIFSIKDERLFYIYEGVSNFFSRMDLDDDLMISKVNDYFLSCMMDISEWCDEYTEYDDYGGHKSRFIFDTLVDILYIQKVEAMKIARKSEMKKFMMDARIEKDLELEFGLDDINDLLFI